MNQDDKFKATLEAFYANPKKWLDEKSKIIDEQSKIAEQYHKQWRKEMEEFGYIRKKKSWAAELRYSFKTVNNKGPKLLNQTPCINNN